MSHFKDMHTGAMYSNPGTESNQEKKTAIDGMIESICGHIDWIFRILSDPKTAEQNHNTKTDFCIQLASQNVQKVIKAIEDNLEKNVNKLTVDSSAFLTPKQLKELSRIDQLIKVAWTLLGSEITIEIMQKPWPAKEGEFVGVEFPTTKSNYRILKFYYDMEPCIEGQTAWHNYVNKSKEGGEL